MADVPPAGAPVLAVPIELRLRYAHGLGKLAPYFSGLERGAAMATRCSNCRLTWFAPRLTCTCGGRDLVWVELTGRGIIAALTHGRVALPGTRFVAETGFALIRLDGADNQCFGRLASAASQLGPGSAVRLARAERQWAHPAQCVEYVPDTERLPGQGIAHPGAVRQA
jgi:uncharacterized OB-fold protein